MLPRPINPRIDREQRGGRRLKVATLTGGPGARSPRRQLEGLRVLVVDSDPATAKSLFVNLVDGGCDVRLVRSAEEALAILDAFVPSVAVLDLVLPRMSGLLLARRLKGRPSTRDALLVALASFKGSKAKRLAIEAGCSAYFQKPIDPEAVAALVANLSSPKRKGAP